MFLSNFKLKSQFILKILDYLDCGRRSRHELTGDGLDLCFIREDFY